MEYKLTSKYQHSKHLRNGTRRSILLYFLNGILIFSQKIPFDENSEYGRSKWHIFNDYILNNKLYQTRSDDNKTRIVTYPLSKEKLMYFDIPKDTKILEEGNITRSAFKYNL